MVYWWHFYWKKKNSNLQYTDDTTLIASVGKEHIAAHQPGENSQQKTWTSRIHASKTKVMVVDRTKRLPVSTILSEYEKVNAFVYLGSIIEADEG